MNKETRQIASNINAQRRRLKRKENKEVAKAKKYLNTLQNEFSAFLFLFDWDDTTHLDFGDGKEVAVEDLKPFHDFNTKWIKWCERWRKDKHLTPVNDNAFHEWAIDNTKNNDDDGICDFIDIKRSRLHGDFFRLSI